MVCQRERNAAMDEAFYLDTESGDHVSDIIFVRNDDQRHVVCEFAQYLELVQSAVSEGITANAAYQYAKS